MLKLLSMHMTSVLFLVQFNNFALTMGFYSITLVARSYALFVCMYEHCVRQVFVTVTKCKYCLEM